MPDKFCRSCGKASVIEDDGQVVCTSCGQVQEDGTTYQLDRGMESYGQACHSGSSFNPTFAQDNYRLRTGNSNRNVCLKKWCKYVKEICERMKVKNREIQKEATGIFERIFKIKYYKQQPGVTKRGLCGSCVYIACRHHDWPILITDLVGVTDAPEYVLKRVNQDIIRELKIEITTTSIEEYVQTCLAKYEIQDKNLVNTTKEVIGLAHDLWLTTGRKALHLVLAACCVVWQASSPENHKKPLENFESKVLKNKHKLTCYTKNRYYELTRVLKLMLTKVPWVSAAVLKKKNSWLFYLDDILRNKKILLSSLEPSKEDGEECEGTDVLAHPAFKASQRKRALGQDDAEHSDNKVTKSGHLTRESMLSTELSEKDIPDDQLDLYIKTPKEVEMAEQLQELVDQ